MVLYIGIAIVAVIVCLVGIVASRPAKFRIERARMIGAPADVLFPVINDLTQWHRWSPFEKLDPNMKKTFEGPASGPGAISSWDGNSKAGAGRTTILECKPNECVILKLEMFRPFACINRVTFQLTPSGSGTQVQWIMEGTNGFMAKAFDLLMNMDSVVGKDFEEGLANLDAITNSDAQRLEHCEDRMD